MKVTLAAVLEPNRATRARLARGLSAAGLKVSTAEQVVDLTREQLVVLGPSLAQPAKQARAARAKATDAILLQSLSKPSRAAHADGVLPLPLSPADLRVRLPELVALRQLKGAVLSKPAGNSAVLDPNTGFYTFTHFKEVLLVEVKRARRYGLPVGLAVMAFDPFRKPPDASLREQLFGGLALAIRRSLRDTDFPVHYSAERVLVLMPHTALHGAVTVSQRICDRIRRSSLPHRGKVLRPTLSVGVAAAPTPGQEMSFSELVKAALHSLEDARAAGGNRVEFFDAGSAVKEPPSPDVEL